MAHIGPGCNKYCLDKNYGGLLIVWDRLFGTFQPERPAEPIAFGIVFQPQFYNPLRHQVGDGWGRREGHFVLVPLFTVFSFE